MAQKRKTEGEVRICMELDAESYAAFRALKARMRSGGKLIVSALGDVVAGSGGLVCAEPTTKATAFLSQSEYRRLAIASAKAGCAVKHLAARLIRQGLGIAA